MKLCVTGAGGFIGRHVLQSLRRRKKDEIEKIIATDRMDRLDVDGVDFVSCDLERDQTDFYERLGRPDAVIYLAWDGLPNYDNPFHQERNFSISSRFLNRLIESGTKNITVVGTCFEYGLQEGCLAETAPTAPVTEYGVAKNKLRLFLEELRSRLPFDLKWIRLFYLFGEGQNKNSILGQLQAALDRGDSVFNMSGGEQLRDYLSVEIAAENIVRIALQNKVCGIVNNCSGKPISIRRLVEEYLHENNSKIELNLGYYPYPDYEPFAFWGDTKKLDGIVK